MKSKTIDQLVTPGVASTGKGAVAFAHLVGAPPTLEPSAPVMVAKKSPAKASAGLLQLVPEEAIANAPIVTVNS